MAQEPGSGRIEREYAAGKGRVDLAVWYGGAWSIIEIKLVHPQEGRKSTIEEGLEQIERYRDHIDASAPAYLVVFDRTQAGRAKSWEERLTREEYGKESDGSVAASGKIVVFGG